MYNTRTFTRTNKVWGGVYSAPWTKLNPFNIHWITIPTLPIQLLLQLISITIPNLSCLLPIGPYLMHPNFLILILIPICPIPTSFTAYFHYNSQPILPVPNCSLSPSPITTLWTLVDSCLGFHIYKTRKECYCWRFTACTIFMTNDN